MPQDVDTCETIRDTRALKHGELLDVRDKDLQFGLIRDRQGHSYTLSITV